MQLPFRFLILVISFILVSGEDFENDPNGYIMFCPCMGRFGNQADHFLGALSLAKALNRTLVLPHWVEFRKGAPRSTQIPFDTYFQVDPLQEYHRVILMADFMKHLAPQVWPAERRVSFCYMERKQLQPQSPVEKPDCHAKDGNPFGPFWDTFNVSFVGSEFYKPLHFDVHYSNVAESWRTRFHPSAWPVLAFTGAPATFPVQSENRELQRYLKWNEKYQQLAREFIRSQLPRGAFIGIHLRNGIDWVRACEHVRDSNQLFASPQCLGYKNEKGQLYPELCYPSKEAIIRQLKRLVKNVRMMHPANEVRSIFVASDSNHMITPLNEAFQRMNITAHKLPEDHPHLDLAILGQSNHFVGNCISSFSSFVKRERDVNGLPSYFWAFPKEKERHHGRAHEEL